MEVLFLIGSIQSFFFATLFFANKISSKAHKVLIAFFLVNGFILLEQYLENKEILFEYPHLLGLTYTLPIVLGPIIYFYTLILTIPKKNLYKRFIFLHFTPFILLTLYFLFDYYFLTAQEKLNYYYKESEIATSIPVYIAELFLNLSIPVYSIVSILQVQNHAKNIKNKFSFSDEINLKWLKIILYFFAVISAVIIITNLLSDVLPVMSFLVGDNLIFGCLTIAIFFIGYYGIKQKVIYSDVSSQPDKKNRYQNSAFNTLENSENLTKLLSIMEQERLYCNSRLSLKNLADRMAFTENNLSQLINEGLHKNFYDFVNEYRVKYFKEMLVNPTNAHLSFLGIAYNCGFNSKSSFNSVFKKQTGMSPSQFKKLSS